jgi:lipopolysaccharide transport system permease protein
MIENLTGLFRYKELLFNFAKKELKIKYRNSVLGFFWSLLNPILMMLVFTFIFTVALPIKNPAIDDYSIFFLAGLLPWNFFNACVIGSTMSIVGNGALVKKVYFPRELLPISISLANLVNLGLEFLVFLAFIIVTAFFNPRFALFYKFIPALLILVPILWLFTVGVSLFVASLNVYLRDIQHLVGIFLMVLFYATPIIYAPPDFGRFNILYKANPMAAMILSFKDALFWMAYPSLKFIIYSLVVAIVTFLFGYFVFLRLEPAFAEEI